MAKLLVTFSLLLLFYVNSNYASSEFEDSKKILISKIRKSFSLSEEVIDKVLEILEKLKTEENELCINQSREVFVALNRSEQWALNLFDSWGKIPPGIFWGNTAELGQYDECLQLEKELDSGTGLLRGQYCLPVISDKPSEPGDNRIPSMRIPIPSDNSLNLRIGICVPDTCSTKTIKDIFTELLNINASQYMITDQLCSRKEDVKFSAVDWFAITFFSLIAALLVLSTIYDYYTTALGKRKIPILIIFSIITNGRNLFQIKKQNSGEVMECLNGIRTLSITWIVISHSFLHFAYMPLINMIFARTWITYYHSMIFINGQIAVDSFFLLSGLLVTWSVMKQLDKTGKLNILLMYFHRYIRLTPIVAAAVLYCSSLVKYSGSGPIWKPTLEGAVLICEKNWWSTLLYVQNYVHPGAMCLGHSWYLAVDTQLYVLSPLILIPLWKWKKRFLWVVVLLVLISISVNFALFVINNFSISVLTDLFDMDRKQRLTYYTTHSRMGAWFVGVLLGYYLHINRGRPIKTPKFIVVFGWLASILTIGAIIFGPYHVQQVETPPTKLESAFYDSFSRVSWAIALSWIIFACTQGYGGIINSFLSLPFWQPFARLSYSIYIVHLIIQFLAISTLRTSKDFSDFEAVRKFWGDFGLALTASVLAVLAFESPVIGLEKLLFNRKPKTASESLQKICSTETLQGDKGSSSSSPQLNV